MTWSDRNLGEGKTSKEWILNLLILDGYFWVCVGDIFQLRGNSALYLRRIALGMWMVKWIAGMCQDYIFLIFDDLRF
jgi:hypothetical protein